MGWFGERKCNEMERKGKKTERFLRNSLIFSWNDRKTTAKTTEND